MAIESVRDDAARKESAESNLGVQPTTKASACALNPGQVAMFFQKGDDFKPVLVMTTAEAMKLADEILSAANVAKRYEQPLEADAATISDEDARRQLACSANYEIFKLAEVAATSICEDENQPALNGMLSRIKVLTEIVYHSMRMHGPDGSDAFTFKSLENAYKGILS